MVSAMHAARSELETLGATKEEEAKYNLLIEQGALNVAHVRGPLFPHLTGVRDILRDWGAPVALQEAGLFHSCYGTDGFKDSIISLDQRERVRSVIGKEAEEIVYYYCACDREAVFPAFNNARTVIDPFPFKDRYTGKVIPMSYEQIHTFCELFVANELEIMRDSQEFTAKHGPGLRELFHRFGPYITERAKTEVDKLLYMYPVTGPDVPQTVYLARE